MSKQYARSIEILWRWYVGKMSKHLLVADDLLGVLINNRNVGTSKVCVLIARFLKSHNLVCFVNNTLRRANRVQRGALIAAQTNASKAQPLVKQAIRASPRVKPVSQVDMDQFVAFSIHISSVFL